jgi:hypothetical protein
LRIVPILWSVEQTNATAHGPAQGRTLRSAAAEAYGLHENGRLTMLMSGI